MTIDEVMKKYLGIPYRHSGRAMDGMDCWGLIKAIYADLGFKLWDIEEPYDEQWAWKGRDHFVENYWREWDQIEQPRAFDGILLMNGAGVHNHGGVMVNEFQFIHACKQGVVLSRVSDFKSRFGGFYRLKAMK